MFARICRPPTQIIHYSIGMEIDQTDADHISLHETEPPEIGETDINF